MEKTGPIVIVDDDLEDLEIYKLALNSLKVKNQILLFSSSEEALEYLKKSTGPFFFIICDINMPLLNGIELRKELNKDSALRLKTIPFLFMSTSDSINHILGSYNSSIQGYFRKPTNYDDIQAMFASVISYWNLSLQPV